METNEPLREIAPEMIEAGVGALELHYSMESRSDLAAAVRDVLEAALAHERAEITPEMIEAGSFVLDVLSEAFHSSFLAEVVYIAMRLAEKDGNPALKSALAARYPSGSIASGFVS